VGGDGGRAGGGEWEGRRGVNAGLWEYVKIQPQLRGGLVLLFCKIFLKEIRTKLVPGRRHLKDLTLTISLDGKKRRVRGKRGTRKGVQIDCIVRKTRT